MSAGRKTPKVIGGSAPVNASTITHSEHVEGVAKPPFTQFWTDTSQSSFRIVLGD
jgi:hypothetical protein